MIRWTLSLVVVVLLNACTVVPENKSIAVDVYPVEHQYSMMFDSKGMAQANIEWHELKQTARHSLLSQPVTFLYANTAGKMAAKRWSNELLKQGAKDALIKVVYSEQLEGFDVQIQFVHYRVVTPLCQPKNISEYAFEQLGCSVNSNLWQSMVEPQASLMKPTDPPAKTGDVL